MATQCGEHIESVQKQYLEWHHFLEIPVLSKISEGACSEWGVPNANTQAGQRRRVFHSPRGSGKVCRQSKMGQQCSVIGLDDSFSRPLCGVTRGPSSAVVRRGLFLPLSKLPALREVSLSKLISVLRAAILLPFSSVHHKPFMGPSREPFHPHLCSQHNRSAANRRRNTGNSQEDQARR